MKGSEGGSLKVRESRIHFDCFKFKIPMRYTRYTISRKQTDKCGILYFLKMTERTSSILRVFLPILFRHHLLMRGQSISLLLNTGRLITMQK